METQQILSFETTSSFDKKTCKLIFEQLINETIDNVFSSLGTRCKEAIYDYLEKKCNLKKDHIADQITEFSEALEQVFGDAAALLEIQIMKRLCREVPQFKHRPEGALTFPEYVNAMNHFFRTCQTE